MEHPSDSADALGGESGPDLWLLAGLPGGLIEASYLTHRQYAAQFRLIVDVLLAQQQHTLTGIAAADLPGLLREHIVQLGADAAVLDDSGFNLKARMADLRRWRVIHIFQDRVTRDADFVLDFDRYQLTETAAQLHRAVLTLGEDVAAGAAATLAPGVLTAQLSVLSAAAGTDPVAAAGAWSVIQTTYRGMADAAASWQARLAGALAGTPDQRKVTIVQETLRRYVDMWGAGVDTHSETITEVVRGLATVTDGQWRRIAVHTLGASADDAAIDELTGSYQQTLSTLRAWFDGPDCQARRLRRQMRDTIRPLLSSQRVLAAVGGHVSRRAELLRLATGIETAADEQQAWRLWCAATGLFSARHLPGAAPVPPGNAGGVSFWDAEPVEVEARLRKQGPKATAGGAPARIADRRDARRAARELALRRRDEAAGTEARVLARSGLPLSQWPQVTTAELDLLLLLLGAVNTARPDPDGVRSAVSDDARWSLRADPAPDGAPSAVVHTPDGRLVHPDIRLHIEPSGNLS
ncbi:DUF2397 domain-containing protein [Actinoplanes sp. NPDC024001]|uniref:DUF2397 domain-containing protein n=1 Tax=Actinoplanes sp. NPDC024001 TaxID=3154598 RepID=UPI0033F3C7B6